jgi:hypothetical protein
MVQTTEPGGSSDFAGDEFANNLFSDLAPLLTLFGEQVTKQFLSMSMGWADNVLLAMGPLGILTIVVSAIRVGGVRQLKTLVGRCIVPFPFFTDRRPSGTDCWKGPRRAYPPQSKNCCRRRRPTYASFGAAIRLSA